MGRGRPSRSSLERRIERALAGRRRVKPEEIARLIVEVNPTGRGLDDAMSAHRYRQKARLQSLLIRRASEQLTVRQEEQPGVVLLGLGRGAAATTISHAVLAELDDDARSWVQRQLDEAASSAPDEGTEGTTRRRGARASSGGGSSRRSVPTGATAASDVGGAASGASPTEGQLDVEQLEVDELLDRGRQLLEEYDYEAARGCFERAARQSGHGAAAALALLELLVDHLADDAAALELQECLPREIRRRPEVAALLATAAARSGRPERALRLVDRVDRERAVDVVLLCCRAVLERGEIDEARRLLERARDLDGTHPEIVDCEQRVEQARAQRRREAEAELERYIEGGEREAATVLAKRLLADDGRSSLAARWLASRAEAEAVDAAQATIARVEELVAEGAWREAVHSLRAAVTTSLPPSLATRLRQRAEGIERAAQQAAEREQIERVCAMLEGAGGDRPVGRAALEEYLRLAPGARAGVRATAPLAELDWLEELPVARDRRASLAAVAALREATELVTTDPEAALSSLDAHERALRSVSAAVELRRKAEQVLTASRAAAARAGLDEAARLLGADRAQRAVALLEPLRARDLDEAGRDERDRLLERARQQVRRAELRDKVAVAETPSTLLAAREGVDRLLTEVEGEERAEWEQQRSALTTRIASAFSLEVHEGGADGGWAEQLTAYAMREAALCILWPQQNAVVAPVVRGGWLTVAVASVPGGRVQRWARLELPDAARADAWVLGSRLWLGSDSGWLLELALDTWEIERWLEGVGGAGAVIEQMWAAGGSGRIWLERRMPGVGYATSVALVDVATGRQLREIVEVQGIAPVAGTASPSILVDHSSGPQAHDDRGRVVRGYELPWRVTAAARHPIEGGLVTLSCDDDDDFALVLTAQTGPSQPVHRRVVAAGVGELIHQLGVSTQAGLAFVQHRGDGGPWLEAFALGSSGEIEPVYRVRCSQDVTLLCDAEASQCGLLASHDEGRILIELGSEPPQIPTGRRSSWGGGFGSLRYWRCGAGAGPHDAGLPELCDELRSLDSVALAARIGEVEAEANRGELRAGLELVDALRLAGGADRWDRADALEERLLQGHPEEGVSRLRVADRAARSGRWAETHRQLRDLDDAILEAAQAQHAAHLRVLCALRAGDLTAAGRWLDRATSRSGHCELRTLVAMLAPAVELSDVVRAAPAPAAEEGDSDEVVAAIGQHRRLLRQADEQLDRGDAGAAVELLERAGVAQRSELQALARLAEAHLRHDGTSSVPQLARQLAFCAFTDAYAGPDSLVHEAMGPERWSRSRIDELAARVQAALGGRRAAITPAPPAEPAGPDGAGDGPGHPPLLAHESLQRQHLWLWRLAEQLAAELGAGRSPRASAADGEPLLIAEQDLLARPEVRARLAEQRAARPAADGAPVDRDRLADELRGHLVAMVNYLLHGRKTFWVDPRLVWMLSETHLDVRGALLQLPYPCCAFAFTDGTALRLAWPLLEQLRRRNQRSAGWEIPRAEEALRPPAPRIVTVYVWRRELDDHTASVELRLGLDALDDCGPRLIARELLVSADGDLDQILDSQAHDSIELALDSVAAAPELRRLQHLVVNAILYATSADCERRELSPPRLRGLGKPPQVLSGETVFFLPNKVEISASRSPAEDGAGGSSRRILKRFPVRGHWRRPPAEARDQRLRWVRPHWRGPDMAAVIERQYRLEP